MGSSSVWKAVRKSSSEAGTPPTKPRAAKEGSAGKELERSGEQGAPAERRVGSRWSEPCMQGDPRASKKGPQEGNRGSRRAGFGS